VTLTFGRGATPPFPLPNVDCLIGVDWGSLRWKRPQRPESPVSTPLSPRHSSSVDLVTMLLVLAGDHQESANANARVLLRLAEPVPVPETPHNRGPASVEHREAFACEVVGNTVVGLGDASGNAGECVGIAAE
jgi:hypothetical protein